MYDTNISEKLRKMTKNKYVKEEKDNLKRNKRKSKK